MFAPYLKNTRVKLQLRKDAVLRADYNHFPSHLDTFFQFVKTTAPLKEISGELMGALSAEETQEFKKIFEQKQSFALDLPSDELRRAAYLFALFQFLLDTAPGASFYQKTYGFIGGADYEETASEMKDQYFLPLYYYYDERIDDADLLLYELLKYKRITEWFHRIDLFEEASRDTSIQERILDENVREFLAKEGFEYPFSTTKSPSGRADIVVPIEEKPLPIEIKIFDNQRYRKDYIRKGFAQALSYAEDYSQPFGYLLVFNLTEQLIQYGKAASEDYCARIETQNKTIFIVTVNIAPIRLTASEQKESRITLIEESYLVAPEEAN